MNPSDSPAVGGEDEILAACTRAVSGLPEFFRGAVCADAMMMAQTLRRLCPSTPCMCIKLEIVQDNACWRWHQDSYTARCILTYVGPGTWLADDKEVRFDQFNETYGMRHEESGPLIVPNFASIHRPAANSVLLMKGNQWPGIQGLGLTHKAPDAPKGVAPIKRIVLKVDHV